MYLDKNNKNLYILDLEGNGLTPDTIWCMVVLHKHTRQVWRFINDGTSSIYTQIRDFIQERPEGYWLGHNIISYDAPVIEHLCGTSIDICRLLDSLVLSYLYNPALKDGHSLEAYGKRLNFFKKEHEDWSKFSPEMLERCEKDVFLTEKVYDALCNRMISIGFTEQSCYIEHRTRRIVDIQQENGCWFDTERAKSLLSELRQRESDLAKTIFELFPPTLEEVGHYKRRVRKDGSYYASYQKHLQDCPLIKEYDDGSYGVYEYVPFNIGSPKQRLERLLGLGFKPTAKTKKGNPKVDEDALVAFATESGIPEVKAIADWLVIHSRITLLAGNPDTSAKGWLDYVRPDGHIHGKVFSCGATTRRMTHNSPNTANVPSAHKAAYGKECRSLWSVEPLRGYKMVGVDASGLENVGLLHYLNNPIATEILNKPKPDDVHTANSRALTEALGREIDREWGSKTTWYAWLYGAYPPKLGEIVKGPPSDGDIVIKTFFKNVPGLKKLIDTVHKEWYNNKGLLETIDGGFVRCPSVNASLNYKIQSLGAIVMKLASIILFDKALEIGLDFKTVLTVHDEWQMTTKEERAEELGKLAVWSIEEAARQLKFKIPLTGEFSVGSNWSETH